MQYYFSVSGEEFRPYYQLFPHSLRAYVGNNRRPFQAIYHKNIQIQFVSISIMPDFYNSYLKEKLEGQYIDPQNAFKQMILGGAFPQLITLLKQIYTYSGNGISAKLFYEGKVLEALSLIWEEVCKNQSRSKKIPSQKTTKKT